MKRILNILNIVLYFLSAVCMAIGYALMKAKSSAVGGFTKEIMKKYHTGLIFKDIAIFLFTSAFLFTAVRLVCNVFEKRKNS